MFLIAPVDQLPGIASSLCLLVRNALSVGSVDPGTLLDAVSQLIDEVE